MSCGSIVNNMTSNKTETTRKKVAAGLGKRYRREILFRSFGMLATAVGMAFLAIFFGSLIAKGSSAFMQTFIQLEVEFNEQILAPDGELDLTYADFDGVIKSALRETFPEVTDRRARRDLYKIISLGAGYQIREMITLSPELLGTRQTLWVPASANVDMLIKGNIDASIDESLRPLSNAQVAWVSSLQDKGQLRKQFNTALFTNGDSRDPELAGIKGALMGTVYM